MKKEKIIKFCNHKFIRSIKKGITNVSYEEYPFCEKCGFIADENYQILLKTPKIYYTNPELLKNAED